MAITTRGRRKALLALALCAAGVGVLAAGGVGDERSGDGTAKTAASRALRARLVGRAGGNAKSEAAVAAGLEWLAAHQAADGHWSLDHFAGDAHCDCTGPGAKNDTAGTAFGLLPFLGAGFTHRAADKQDSHARTVERGLTFLLKQQTKEGDFGGGMYANGLAAIAVCQAYGLSADPMLKEPAQRGLDYIVSAQDPAGGGWRYAPRQGGDTSVTGWQVQALEVGELAGLQVPRETLDLAARYLDSCESPNGSYGYIARSGVTPTMTASALLCRECVGWGKRSPAPEGGVGLLRQSQPGTIPSMYYNSYATQVLFMRGGPAWEEWNRKMRDLLVEGQDQGKDANHRHQKGSWSPAGDVFGSAGGRLMATSLALLTLEVYYRTDLVLAARPARELKPADLDALWTALATGGFGARKAVWDLAGDPQRAVPFLKEKLPPASVPVDRKRLTQAAIDLDDDSFAVRQKAAEDLEKAGELAEPVLRKALEGKPSAEVRRRVGVLLEKLADAGTSPEWLRTTRALEALERAGTPEARQLLEALAKGTPEARLTREAKATLERLKEAGPEEK
jgi:hypothetical protein